MTHTFGACELLYVSATFYSRERGVGFTFPNQNKVPLRSSHDAEGYAALSVII